MPAIAVALILCLSTVSAYAADLPKLRFSAERIAGSPSTCVGSVTLEWDNATIQAAWDLGRQSWIPELSVSTATRVLERGRATATLNDVLKVPAFTAQMTLHPGALLTEVAASVKMQLLSRDMTTWSLRADASPGENVKLGAHVLLGAQGWMGAGVSASTSLPFGDIGFSREWGQRASVRTAYRVDIPAIGIGLTHTKSSTLAGTRSQTSWHAVASAVVVDSNPSLMLERVLNPVLLPPVVARLTNAECDACSISTAANSDHTIGFGETMVGDMSESGIILNCPSSVFCWLAEVYSRPSSPFSVEYAPIGSTIPYGSERRLELGFTPTEPGEYRDSITIRYCFAYWVEWEDEFALIVDEMEGYYTHRCQLFTFPMEGVALAKPEAVIDYSPERPICGRDVAFDGSGSYDPNPQGEVVSYRWEFDDGTTSTQERPIHRFSGAGEHTVTLTVYNNRDMSSDPSTITIRLQVDVLETAATIGAAAAAGWATHTLSMAAPVLAAAVPGAALAISSIVGTAGLASFPIDQLVLRFPETWSRQDVAELIARNIPGAQVVGYFSTLKAFLIQFPLPDTSAEAAEAELDLVRAKLDRILPPGTQLGNNYIGRFEGSSGTSDPYISYDVEHLEADFRVAYDAIRAPEAWRRMSDSDISLQPVRIAVIDTGISAEHDEFAIPLRGRSYVADGNATRPWYEDEGGHGTQISGIIGAENGQGRTNGLLASCEGQYEMQVYRVIGDMFSVWDCMRIAVSRAEDELNAWSEAVKTGTRRKSVVLNISLGWDLDELPDSERVLAKNAFLDLFDSYPDTLFVTSAGNGDKPDDLVVSKGKEIDRGSSVHAPGGLFVANNLTVAATDATGSELMSWSNYGTGVDIAAPGYEVFTTDTEGGYTWRVEGTSYAAAMVSGVAAAILSIDPGLSPSDVKELLLSSPSRVRAPDGTVIPVLDFADAAEKAIRSRQERRRLTLWRAVGLASGILIAGILVFRPF